MAACGSGHLRFCFGSAAKRKGKHREHLQAGRVITATEKGGEIESRGPLYQHARIEDRDGTGEGIAPKVLLAIQSHDAMIVLTSHH